MLLLALALHDGLGGLDDLVGAKGPVLAVEHPLHLVVDGGDAAVETRGRGLELEACLLERLAGSPLALLELCGEAVELLGAEDLAQHHLALAGVGAEQVPEGPLGDHGDLAELLVGKAKEVGHEVVGGPDVRGQRYPTARYLGGGGLGDQRVVSGLGVLAGEHLLGRAGDRVILPGVLEGEPHLGGRGVVGEVGAQGRDVTRS